MAAGGAAEYPAHWEADVVLRDGSTMHVRPIRPSDAEALQRFHVQQSEQSTYFRFFAPRPQLSDEETVHLTRVDHVDRVALVLTSGVEIVAVGRYDRIDRASAEVAFNVADSAQGRGLGSVLLEHLAAAARERGIRSFRADVLPGNARMISVFRDAGYDVRQAYDEGVVTLSFDIDPTERSLAVMAEREQHADAESMRRILGAASVVVVIADAASTVDVALARQAARSVLDSGFTGSVHLVGEELSDLRGRSPAQAGGPRERTSWHASLESVPGPVDIAVVAAPDAGMAGVASGVARLGGRGVVLLSAADDARFLLRTVRRSGLRLVGPESFGVVADAPGGRLNATLGRALPPEGGLSVFCQSAAAGLALLRATRRRGIGLATFLSAGGRADVSGNDAMQFWLGHEKTTTVALYLESIGNPRKFSRVARRLSSSRPVVAVVTAATGGSRKLAHVVPASGHARRVLEEMLRQSGAILAEDVDDMLDVVQLLQSQPLPRGDRVAVVAGSASLGNLVSDVVESQGLVPSGVVVLHHAAGGAEYRAAVQDWATAGDADALVVAYEPTLGKLDREVLAAIAAAADPRRPVLACVLGLHGSTRELAVPGATVVPAFASVEDAGRALAAAVWYGRWRARPDSGPVRPSEIDQRSARDLVERLAAHLPPGTRQPLSSAELTALLACYGIRLWPSRPARGVAEAVAAADDLGWPVAVKTRDERLRHRLDLGGVRLDVADEDDMRAALARLAALPVERPLPDPPFEIQAMAPLGVACVVRAREHPLYGPVISFGVAGDAVDLLDDLSHGIPPLSQEDVAEMVSSIRAAPRLTGYRGLPAYDVPALEDVLARVSLLKDDLPEVESLVLHPVVVAEQGAAVLEAHATVADPLRRDRARRVLPA